MEWKMERNGKESKEGGGGKEGGGRREEGGRKEGGSNRITKTRTQPERGWEKKQINQ